MKCLACWEEIPEESKICSMCGSDQQDAKDFLTLALLLQQKNKIAVPEESNILKYIFEIDPSAMDYISVPSSVTTQPFQEAKPIPISPITPMEETGSSVHAQANSYQPSKPQWLKEPVETIETTPAGTIKKTPKKEGIKMIVCPHCTEEVPSHNFCKLCGKPLMISCPECETKVSITTKYCSGCGHIMQEPKK
ncbi:MAG: zinc ribbon domain-containing protein [Candidatus Heimdallarchaeota archaeon]|nr:zinc ribbon domain-containing protein [Candidatus Heimdallarchaeota archaeon]